MATDGKQSRFTLKAMGYSAACFFVAWGATKLLDTYLNLSFLKVVHSFFVDIWSWLSYEEPVSRWLILIAMGTFFVFTDMLIKLKRKVGTAEFTGMISDIAGAIASPPKAPKLSDIQHNIIMQIGLNVDEKIPLIPDSLSRDCRLTVLEFEVALRQLVSMNLIEWSPVRRGERQSPRLTHKGQEYILKARSHAKRTEE